MLGGTGPLQYIERAAMAWCIGALSDESSADNGR